MSEGNQKTTTENAERYFFHASAADFKKIPGSPIAYWVNNAIREAFLAKNSIERLFKPRKGIDTGNNDLFLRFWFEVGSRQIGFGCQSEEESEKSQKKWFPYNKGGEFRKWYGNFNYVVDWEYSGQRIRNYENDKGKLRSNLRNQSFFFKEGVTWTDVSSSCFGARYLPISLPSSHLPSATLGWTHRSRSDSMLSKSTRRASCPQHNYPNRSAASRSGRMN